MKKERFFRLLGELDDRILEQYRQMDATLSHKALRKKRALRALIIAACLALLIGACVPVGMLAHPAGRAILRGDSEALTEQLNRIDGFKPWQEITAEKLEQSLSPKAWESLQKIPVINVLTQSQYPDYAFKSMKYGAYLERPEYLTYGFSDLIGDYFPDRVDIDVYGAEYQDPNAAGTCPPPPGSSLEEGQVLPYRYSMPQTLYTQAVHVYELNVDKVRNTVYVDAQTGECVYWEIGKASSYSPTVADEQTMIDAAYDILVQSVRDPEAYTLSTERNDSYFICRYNRCIGDFESCDGLTVRFDLAGNIVSVSMAYLGALRYLTEIPQDLVDQIEAYMKQEVAEADSSEMQIGKITILPDGRIALDCSMEVTYYGKGSEMGFSDATWFLACLTEPTGGYEDVDVATTTELVTTVPVTTEPVTTEPVTTQPPRETESQWNPDEIPDFVKLGYLNVLIYDENDELVYRMNAEKLKAIDGELSVGYVSGGTVVVECYAAYDRSGSVARYRIGRGTIQRIEASAIKSDVTVDVDADYYHYLRIVIPMDELTVGETTGLYLIGDYSDSSIEGWAMWEELNVYADETPPDQDVEITGPTETTESDANTDLPAQFLRAGILSIDFQDENGVVSSVISEDEIGGLNGKVLELEEIPRGDFIVDFYACFNQSNNVTFSVVMPDGVILEPLDESSIKGRLPWKPWETDADYVLGFRIVIPREVLEIGHRGAIVFLEPEDSYPVIQVWFDIKNS